jgi:hypothetical protein
MEPIWKTSKKKRAIISVGLFILFILIIASAIMIRIEEDNPQSHSLHVWVVFMPLVE